MLQFGVGFGSFLGDYQMIHSVVKVMSLSMELEIKKL